MIATDEALHAMVITVGLMVDSAGTAWKNNEMYIITAPTIIK
jgi:hypothetical protein